MDITMSNLTQVTSGDNLITIKSYLFGADQIIGQTKKHDVRCSFQKY